MSDDYTSHTHYQKTIHPNIIDFSPTKSTEGGSINFYFNGASSTTTTICEAAAGMVKLNGNEILTKEHFLVLSGSVFTFSSGVATYSNSRITAASIPFIQRNTASAGNAFAFTARCTAGTLTVATDASVSVALNVNVIIFIP